MADGASASKLLNRKLRHFVQHHFSPNGRRSPPRASIAFLQSDRDDTGVHNEP